MVRSNAGIEVIYVTGNSRDQHGAVDGVGHAWNAVRIEDEWYLMDATWDAGYVTGDTFTKQYETTYLFPPPEVTVPLHSASTPVPETIELVSVMAPPASML